MTSTLSLLSLSLFSSIYCSRSFSYFFCDKPLCKSARDVFEKNNNNQQTNKKTKNKKKQKQKITTNHEVYKQAFWEITSIHQNYVQIFTDGSEVDQTVAAAAVSSIARNSPFSCRLKDYCSIYTAELQAIMFMDFFFFFFRNTIRFTSTR